MWPQSVIIISMSQDNKTEMVKMRVTPSEKAAITASAERRGVTTSELVREVALKAAEKK